MGAKSTVWFTWNRHHSCGIVKFKKKKSVVKPLQVGCVCVCIVCHDQEVYKVFEEGLCPLKLVKVYGFELMIRVKHLSQAWWYTAVMSALGS